VHAPTKKDEGNRWLIRVTAEVNSLAEQVGCDGVTACNRAAGAWTARNQMSINGKRDEFTLVYLLAMGRSGGIKSLKATSIAEPVSTAVEEWPQNAQDVGIDSGTAA